MASWTWAWWEILRLLVVCSLNVFLTRGLVIKAILVLVGDSSSVHILLLASSGLTRWPKQWDSPCYGRWTSRIMNDKKPVAFLSSLLQIIHWLMQYNSSRTGLGHLGNFWNSSLAAFFSTGIWPVSFMRILELYLVILNPLYMCHSSIKKFTLKEHL